MVLDALRIYWKDPFAQRNGRRGQRQHGVDIFGTSSGHFVGGQAKNSEAISESVVRHEVAEAEKFVPRLSRFLLAVAGPRDGHLQEFARVLCQERLARGQFAIEILSFDDVCHELSSSPDLVRKYWGDFLGDIESLIRALPRALSGPVMDAEAAMDRVMETPEFQEFANMLDERSGGTVTAHVRVSGGPHLDAEPGTPERAWFVSIGERHEEHVAMLSHVAVDFDSGAILLHDFATDTWRRREDIKDPFDIVFQRGISTDESAEPSCGDVTIGDHVGETAEHADGDQASPELPIADESGDSAERSESAELATVGEDDRGIVFTVRCASLFAPGKTELVPGGKRVLSRLATILGRLTNANSIIVEGHTDSIGSLTTNEDLSQARALAVRAHLVSTGIRAEWISAVGKGKSSPVESNRTPEGRARNRRVEIVISRSHVPSFKED